MTAAPDERPDEIGAEEAIVRAQAHEEARRDAEASRQTARGAAFVTLGIILSRLVGLVRQRLVAHFFGTSIFADVLAAAFRVGNITQNLLGEGTLSASFIPVYAKLRGEGRVEESRRFALSSLGLLGAAALVASIVGVLFAPWLTLAIAAGFDVERLDSTVRVVRVLFPMTGLLVLSAWGLGVLNAHRKFFLPYAAPVLWSLAQIAAIALFGFVLHEHGESLAMVVAWSALAGAALQALVLFPVARRLLGKLWPSFDTKDPNVREAGKRLPAILLGRGVIQISGLLDTLLVSFLGPGANAALNYAQTVYLLPMALLGTGEAAAALPDLAEQTAADDREARHRALRKRLGASLARVTILTVPASFVFVLLGRQLIAVLLQGGKFDRAATSQVEPLVMAYGFALLGNASARILTTACYAIGDARTPARYAVYRVVASAIGAFALMRPFGAMGVVLGAVIAAWVETLALGVKLQKDIGGIGLEAIPFAKIALVSALSIGPAYAVRALAPEAFATRFTGGVVILGVFGLAFSIAAPALGLFDVRSFLRRRR